MLGWDGVAEGYWQLGCVGLKASTEGDQGLQSSGTQSQSKEIDLVVKANNSVQSSGQCDGLSKAKRIESCSPCRTRVYGRAVREAR